MAFPITLICPLVLLSAMMAALDTSASLMQSEAKLDIETINLETRERNDCEEERVASTSSDLLKSVLPKDCGRRFLKRGRVSGGYTAQLGEFPSYVRVDVLWKGKTDPRPACGGTLISDRHVLTAAHCFVSYKIVSVSVATTIYRNQSSLVYPVDRICLQPKFNTTSKDIFLGYDMALLRLARPVKFSRNVQPACLPKRRSKGQKNLRAVGLGVTWVNPDDGGDVRYPERLQALPVKWKNCEDLHITQFCVNTEDPRYVGNTCSGDSGGPIYGLEDGRMVVVGISSYGSGGCKRGVAALSVHTDVYVGSRWLVELMTKCQ